MGKDGNVVIIIIGILEIYDYFQSYYYAPNLTPPWQIYGIYSIYYITRICCQILTLKSCIKHFFGCNFMIRSLSLPYLLSTKSVCHLNLFSNIRLYFITFCVNDVWFKGIRIRHIFSIIRYPNLYGINYTLFGIKFFYNHAK